MRRPRGCPGRCSASVSSPSSTGSPGWRTAPAPPQNRPTRLEEERCRPFLAAELSLLHRVTVVLVLGRFAHDAWLKASGWWARLPPRDRPRFAHGARSRLPDGTELLSSYHPSRRNTNTGTLTRAMWYRIFGSARRAVRGAGA